MLGRMLAGWEALEAFAFPQQCRGCGLQVARGHLLCAGCWRRVPECGLELCVRCLVREADPAGCTRHHGFAARAARLYDERMAAVVHAFKFEGRLDLAPVLAGTMAEVVRAIPDLVIAVPLHPSRERERGFNHAALLAVELAERIGVPFLVGGLVRVRPTRPQARLAAERRRLNLAGAFRVPTPRALAGRSVLVVDDVVTTGATLEACLEELGRCGARGAGLALAWAQ